MEAGQNEALTRKMRVEEDGTLLKESAPINEEAPQLVRAQYQFVHSDQPLQINFTPHFTQTNHHTPSKTTSQTTGGKQGERRLDRKMGDNQIERREKKETREEVGK